MLSPPFYFSLAAACPPAPAAAAPPPADQPGGTALGPDGVAHVLVQDAHAVCWWAVTEDGDAALRAVWPLPGPHPVAIDVAETGLIVLTGRTEAGWAVTTIAPDGRTREIAVGERGGLYRFEVDAPGTVARLAWREPTGTVYDRVDLGSGRVDELSRVTTPKGGSHARQ